MLMLIAAAAALIFGIVAIVEGPRNWAAWGVIALAIGHIVSFLA